MKKAAVQAVIIHISMLILLTQDVNGQQSTYCENYQYLLY